MPPRKGGLSGHSSPSFAPINLPLVRQEKRTLTCNSVDSDDIWSNETRQMAHYLLLCLGKDQPQLGSQIVRVRIVACGPSHGSLVGSFDKDAAMYDAAAEQVMDIS